MSEKISISQFSDELAQTIPYLARVSRSIISRQSDALTEGKITFPQYLVLDILVSREILKMKDIANALHISLPAATGLIKRMVSLKMVKRIYDKSDRRLVYIKISPSGKKILERVASARKKSIEKMFICLSEKERTAYLRIIRKIKNNLHENDRED